MKMHKNSLNNLRVPSSIQARINGSKGGKASAKSKKKIKTIKEVLETALSSKVLRPNDLQHLKFYYPEVSDDDLTTLFLGVALIIDDFTDIYTKPAERLRTFELINNIINANK